MAWPALEERQNHVLKGHSMMILPYGRRRTLRQQVGSLNSQVTDYLGIPTFGHYGVVQSGPPAGGQPSAPGSGRGPGAAIELGSVVGPSRAGADADAGAPGAGLPGVSLVVPPGQSLALLGQPPATATDLFDAIAGSARLGPGWYG